MLVTLSDFSLNISQNPMVYAICLGDRRAACTVEPFGVLLGADFFLVVGVDPVDDGIPLGAVHGGGADVIPLAGDNPSRVVVWAEWTESFSISDRLAYICQIISLESEISQTVIS